MASFQLPFRDNPNSSVAVHGHPADATSSDNESQHAEALSTNAAIHVHVTDNASYENKDEPIGEAKYSNPINGHFPPQPGDGPPVDLIKKQRGKVQWLPKFNADSHPLMVEDVDVATIKIVVAAHVHLIGLDKDDFEVEFFADGDFNALYTVRNASQPPGTGPEYIFRVCMPLYPWYKVESEIAALELVRMYTDIPVPKVYAYDSDAENPVHHEWMMMDKMTGVPLYVAREEMDIEQKTKLARTLADWMHQLSTLHFDNIGSIYRRRLKPATSKDDFKVGPIIDMAFVADWRLEYKLHRGPYTSIEQFFRALIDVNHADVLDPRQKARSEFHTARTELEWLTDNLDYDYIWDQERIGKFQEFWASQPQEAKEARIGQLRSHVTSYEAHLDGFRETVIHERPRYDLGPPNDERTTDLFPRLAAQCRALLFAVPHQCPAETLSKFSTVLHHWDISERNVLVDPTSGTAVALIDWEQVQTLPFSLIHPFPSALDGSYYTTMPPQVPLAPDPDAGLDSPYLRKVHLECVENTLLRWTFRQRLEELQSPHLETFNQREPDLKDLLELARYADQTCNWDRVKELVEKVEREIDRGF